MPLWQYVLHVLESPVIVNSAVLYTQFPFKREQWNGLNLPICGNHLTATLYSRFPLQEGTKLEIRIEYPDNATDALGNIDKMRYVCQFDAWRMNFYFRPRKGPSVREGSTYRRPPGVT